MNSGPRLATRSFRMASLAISLLALSTAATVAHAQQRPSEFRDDTSDDSTFDANFDFRAAAPEAGFVVASTAVDALGAGPRQLRETPETARTATPVHHRVPVVSDWSTKHMVFGAPKTEAQKAHVEHNTRYKMQVARRNAPAFRKVADASTDSGLLNRFSHRGLDPQHAVRKLVSLAAIGALDWEAP